MGNIKQSFFKKRNYFFLIILLPLMMTCGIQVTPLLNDPNRETGFQRQVDSRHIENDKFSIILFSEEFCKSCIEETEMIRDYLKGESVSRIKLITILVGATEEDAKYWKDQWGVFWPVETDRDGRYYKRACQKIISVPCIIINHPKQGVIFHHVGKSSIKDLEYFTGPWRD